VSSVERYLWFLVLDHADNSSFECNVVASSSERAIAAARLAMEAYWKRSGQWVEDPDDDPDALEASDYEVVKLERKDLVEWILE